MPLHMGPLKRTDLPAVHELWNAIYVHDRVDLKRFTNITCDDPHVNPDGAFIMFDDQKIAGFAVCATPGEANDVTFLKGLAAAKENAISALLDHTESVARTRGSRYIRVVHYLHGAYFFPGIDKRYASLLKHFQDHGYTEREEARDVHIKLSDFAVNDRQREKIGRVRSEGIEICTYEKQW